MATSLIVLVVLTLVGFSCAVGLMMWYIRRTMEDHVLDDARAGLRETFSPRSVGLEHRIDVATSEAATSFNECSVCAFANAKQARFCALCGNKTKRTPTEMVRAQEALTAKQEQVRRRTEWRRRQDHDGRVVWHYHPVEKARVEAHLAGFAVRFEDPSGAEAGSATEGELQSAPTPGPSRPDSTSRRVKLVPATSASALAFPLTTPGSGQLSANTAYNEAELLALADTPFPAKFAYFVARSASLIRPAEVEALELAIHREFIVEESLDFLGCLKKSQLHSVVRINFSKESGIDAGGVHREWLMLLNELMVDPALGLFTCTNSADQTYYLDGAASPSAVQSQLAQMFAIGRLVGRVLLEGEVLGFHLAQPLLKIALGYPLAWDDLAFLDPVMHKSLQWMLQNEGAERLGVDFTVARSSTSSETVELIPGGSETPVTDANKHQYVERVAQYLLVERIAEPLHAFLRGLYQVVPRPILLLFDAQELDYLLCGSDTIDVSDWERHTKSSRSLRNSRVLRWFWQLVRDMPHEYRRRLLQFATGCSRVPLVGFRGLTSYDGRICPFTLKGVAYETTPYIRSHACFNRLDLPLYKTRSELREMLYAVLDTDMYGFTTA